MATVPVTPDLGRLLTELQSRGVRLEGPVEARRGGAGPSDAGMIHVEGVPVTVPVTAGYVAGSPFTMRREDEGWGIYREGVRLASAQAPERPRYYALSTDDGIPYWKIALLHLDSLASTVIQSCAYWGTDDQCRFCGIELTLEAGSTVRVKRPEHLAEVAVAARDLDGAVDVTLTTGSTTVPVDSSAAQAVVASANAALKPSGCVTPASRDSVQLTIIYPSSVPIAASHSGPPGSGSAAYSRCTTRRWLGSRAADEAWSTGAAMILLSGAPLCPHPPAASAASRGMQRRAAFTRP